MPVSARLSACRTNMCHFARESLRATLHLDLLQPMMLLLHANTDGGLRTAAVENNLLKLTSLRLPSMSPALSDWPLPVTACQRMHCPACCPACCTAGGVCMYRGVPFMTSKGPVTATIPNAQVA